MFQIAINTTNDTDISCKCSKNFVRFEVLYTIPSTLGSFEMSEFI